MVKTKKIIISIVFILVLSLSINVEASCSKTGTAAYCEYVNCASKGEESCKTNTACCSWSEDTNTDDCEITGASFSHSYRGAGKTNTLTVKTSGNCKGKTFTYSKGCDGTSCTVPNKCDKVEVTVSYGNKSSASASYTARGEWQPASNIHLRKNDVDKLPMGPDSADKAKRDVYAKSCSEEIDDPGVYLCTGIHTRCGASTGDLPNPMCYRSSKGELRWTRDSSWGTPEKNIPENKCKNCYANSTDLETATNTKYGAYGKANGTATPHFIKDKTEEQCFPVYKFCTPQDYGPTDRETTTTMCENDTNNTTFNFNDGKKCDGNAFYSITCSNTVKIKFDNGDDLTNGNPIGTTNNIYVGEGFKFGIKLTATRSCTGTFYDTWKTAYNRMKKEQDRLISEICKNKKCTVDDLTEAYTKKLCESKDETVEKSCKIKAKRIHWLEDTMNRDMIGFVNQYNAYSPTPKVDVSNTSASFSLQGYKVNGKDKKLETNYIVDVINQGTGSYSKNQVVNLGISGVTNPKNYVWSSTSPKVIKMYFPKSYIDKLTGELANSGLDVGNKLFTDYETDLGTYKMKINVKTYDRSKLKVNNNICELKVNKNEYSYRPIELSNPFINEKWEKGKNWYNTIYDFTQTIHKTTWSEKTYSTINLSSNDIANIKSSNSSNQSQYPYLGLCDKVNSSSQDAGTKAICRQITNIK